MSKPWIIGDWAAEAERAEEEEKARAAAAAAAASAAPIEASSARADSLSAKSRKKKQTLSISEFTTGRSVSHGTRTRDITDSRAFTAPQGMMMLPTGPGDRSGEQDRYSSLSGGHRGGGDYRGASDRLAGDRGYGGRLENDRMVSGFLRDREPTEPSRADGSSDWSSLKRTTFSQVGGHGGERRPLPDGEKRSLRHGHPDLPSSRADGVDNWGLVKRSLPLAPAESRPARRNEDTRQIPRADEADDWTSLKKTVSPPVVEVIHAKSRADEAASWLSFKTESHAQEPRAASDWLRTMPQHQQEAQNLQRRPVVLAPQVRPRSPSPSSGVANADVSSALPPKPKSNHVGSTRSREEVLTSRDSDDQNQTDTRERGSRPFSSQSSRPITPEISGVPAVKPRTKVNPFGNAKPREVLLQERGKDWRKMDFDLEHRAVERPETQEEIALREEIRVLTELSKQELETSPQRTNGYVPDPSVKQNARLHDFLEDLRIKENQLQQLTMALDDKVRFSQKILGRVGSQSGRNEFGRSAEMFERSGSRPSSRPGSQSGRSDVGSNYDSTERPESRRGFEASDRTNSLSEYGMWSRTGQVASSRESTREAPERVGSWSGGKDTRGFEPSLRPGWRSATLEVGVADNYSQRAGGPDIWTRTNDGSKDRSTGWRGQERGPYRGGARRF